MSILYLNLGLRRVFLVELSFLESQEFLVVDKGSKELNNVIQMLGLDSCLNNLFIQNFIKPLCHILPNTYKIERIFFVLSYFSPNLVLSYPLKVISIKLSEVSKNSFKENVQSDTLLVKNISFR